MKTQIIVLMSILLLWANASPKVQQLNPSKLTSFIQENQFSLIYFYSATCQFCQQFTPKFEQLAKVYPDERVFFGKIDGVAYKDVTTKYDVYSYPTIALFWKNIDMPIFYRKERQVQNLMAFLKQGTKPFSRSISPQNFQKLSKEQRQSGITFVGNADSHESNVVTVLTFLQNYRGFAKMQANVTRPYLQIKGQQFYDFDDPAKLRSAIRKAFARLFIIEEESWLRIHEKKETGIVFIDTKNNQRVTSILEKLAVQMPDIVFMRIDPSQEEYKSALDALGVEPDQNIFGVDQKAQAKFQAPKPYNEESLKQFIEGVLDRSLPVYLRSEKANHKQKLTRQNYDQKINEPKDVVLFMYRDQDRIQKKFLQLFKYLTEKLKNNPNISLLRCNLSKNEIVDKLQFEPNVTPWISFLGHRMKKNPVHYQKQVISAENVIEFIMENTTFDWEDEWGEL